MKMNNAYQWEEVWQVNNGNTIKDVKKVNV